MDLRRLLAFLVMGCSSSTHSASRTTIDNAAPHREADSGDNSQCPAWPLEKLFPVVGPFFYGPDKGPCSATETDRPSGAVPKTFTVNYTYNGEQPAMAHTPAGSTLVHQYEYTYLQGLLSKELDFKEGLQSQITYTYDTHKASYLLIDAGGNRFQYDYTLDPNGYPTSVDLGTYVNGTLTPPASGPARFVFEYERCAIQRRAALTLAGDPSAPSTSTYVYDDAGHLVDINSPDREVVYDYACWAPLDAGSDSGPL